MYKEIERGSLYDRDCCRATPSYGGGKGVYKKKVSVNEMKCKVLVGFFDKTDKERFKKVDTILDVDEARFNELSKKKLVEKVEESTAKAGKADEKSEKK